MNVLHFFLKVSVLQQITLIERIEVHNSEKGKDGLKHVPIDISFTAVGIINIPTEKELIAAMEEMRENLLKSA